jgi:hypothetical protein
VEAWAALLHAAADPGVSWPPGGADDVSAPSTAATQV